MTETTIKNIYYVDTSDNTKNSVIAIGSDVDMRSPEVCSKIAEKIGEIFPLECISSHKEEIAKCIAHHEFANIFEYEFGVEEIDFLS
jgi:hypothetical protein